MSLKNVKSLFLDTGSLIHQLIVNGWKVRERDITKVRNDFILRNTSDIELSLYSRVS